jgi:putative colanic acid biosynthesis glycosyltransferase
VLFSVITVTRNNLPRLKQTHDSLRAQAGADYEWIVIDGASDDGTAAYLKTIPAQWISEPDGGIYDAMNKGIDRAQGDYIIFMNAGDEFPAPEVLAKLALINADFIYGDSLEGGRHKPARPHAGILYGMFTHHQAMVYRRDAIGALRYDTKYKIAADYKFTLEFLRHAVSVSYAPFPVCVFEQGGVSQQRVRLGRNEQFLIRREMDACGWIENVMIYLAQSAVMILRCAAPGIYWRLRSNRCA